VPDYAHKPGYWQVSWKPLEGSMHMIDFNNREEASIFLKGLLNEYAVEGTEMSNLGYYSCQYIRFGEERS